MVRESGTAVYRAYATPENADLGGSRFVGDVQLRGARGRVWLHGRRIPTRRLWAHAGGRVTGSVWSVVWRVVAFWWGWWPIAPPDRTAGGDNLWKTLETRQETVSWSVAKSRHMSNLPVASTLVNYSEAALPARMGVRRRSTKVATQTLERERSPGRRIHMEVPLGPRGRMTQLHLEVSGAEHDGLMRVLSGSVP